MKELYHGTIALFDVIDVNAGKGYKHGSGDGFVFGIKGICYGYTNGRIGR